MSKRLFDPRFDSLHPAGIAYCRNPHDVATCLAFVRKFGVPVAARCGGHSYAGWSSTSGLIIDVTRMSGVNVSGSTATVGAGTRLIDFYNGLAAHGRGVPGGSCPTVGIAGLTLGGGVGVVSRAYGLTSDNVQSLQIVTADGQVRTCNSSQNSDLFWACRGGGGGNFGVVTSFTFRTHPVGRDRPVLPVLAVVAGRPGDLRLAVLGAARPGRALVEPAPGRGAGRLGPDHPGGRHLPGQPQRRRPPSWRSCTRRRARIRPRRSWRPPPGCTRCWSRRAAPA